ncbi:unnamed protein product [Phytophthora fragariaefolia]|uniref:Unnamed protein product n=1 Tax=Phytophthora fragariaefolia TaxID=1490495 RepID=A0A9W6XMR8_9STRA|nr:unnamed protein product [Phytophthora fragariaefolia]
MPPLPHQSTQQAAAIDARVELSAALSSSDLSPTIANLDASSTFVNLVQTVLVTLAPTPETYNISETSQSTVGPLTTEISQTVPAGHGPSHRNQTKPPAKHDSDKSLNFSWTPEAGDALLRTQFVKLKCRFQSTKSTVQLAAAWMLVATETVLASGLEVKPAQCKSKVKDYVKDINFYQSNFYFVYIYIIAAQAHSQTIHCFSRCERSDRKSHRKAIKEPMCYSTMCDVGADHDGMGADPFFVVTPGVSRMRSKLVRPPPSIGVNHLHLTE